MSSTTKKENNPMSSTPCGHERPPQLWFLSLSLIFSFKEHNYYYLRKKVNRGLGFKMILNSDLKIRNQNLKS